MRLKSLQILHLTFLCRSPTGYTVEKRRKESDGSSAYLLAIANKIKELPQAQKRHTEKIRPLGSGKNIPQSSDSNISKTIYDNCLNKYMEGPGAKRIESYEGDFKYGGFIHHNSNPPNKNYISPMFQNEFREITQKRGLDHPNMHRAAKMTPEDSLAQARAILDSESMNPRAKTRPGVSTDAQGMNMHKARSTDVSNNTTPVSLPPENNKFKSRALTKETSSGLDQRRHGGKNIHVSAGEQIVSNKNRTPGKSYIYHMDASF